jgi:hypothetical protein
MGCRTDSGDLFQPNLTELWYVPRSQVNEAATTLVANLRASGWRGPAAPDGDSYNLSLDLHGWKAYATVFASDPSDASYVNAEIQTDGPKPCTLSSR